MVIGIIVALVIVLILLYFSSQKKKIQADNTQVSQRTQVTSEPRTIRTGLLDDEVMEIFIAGLGHHCTKADIGTFSGVIFNEKDNPVDKKAMAIGNHFTKKIIGYVPNAVLDDYRKWCKREKRPCMGFIYWDGEHLRGRCRVYPTNNEEDMERYSEDGTKYAQLVAEHFGWKLNEDGSIK